MQVAGVTGDVNVIVCRRTQVKAHCQVINNNGGNIFTNIFLITVVSAASAICVSLLTQTDTCRSDYKKAAKCSTFS